MKINWRLLWFKLRRPKWTQEEIDEINRRADKRYRNFS